MAKVTLRHERKMRRSLYCRPFAKCVPSRQPISERDSRNGRSDVTGDLYNALPGPPLCLFLNKKYTRRIANDIILARAGEGGIKLLV